MKTIKKLLSGILAISLLSASFVIPTFAENDISVVLNGNAIGFDVPPQIINERTMVPLRAIFEALGASVDWNGDTRTVTSEKDGTTISLTIDDPTMYVNGDAVTLDSPGCIIDGRTLVPVRAISEAYGTEVGWDGDTRTVKLSTVGQQINLHTKKTDVDYRESYDKFAAEIKEKGEYQDGSYKVLYEIRNGEAVILDKGDLLCANMTYLNTTNGNRVDLYIYRGVIPSINICIDYKNLDGFFDDVTHLFNKRTSEFDVEGETKAIELKDEALAYFDRSLKAKGFSMTLQDMGIEYINESSNSNQSINSTPFERLKNGIINQGIKSSKSESYVIMDQYNGFKLTMIYQEGESAGFMYQSDGENATQITVIIYEDENQESGVVINTNSFGEERGLIGKYSKTTHKLLKTSSTLYSFEETAVIQLLNTMLGFVDNSLQTKGIDVNLEELGILYDKE